MPRPPASVHALAWSTTKRTRRQTSRASGPASAVSSTRRSSTIASSSSAGPARPIRRAIEPTWAIASRDRMAVEPVGRRVGEQVPAAAGRLPLVQLDVAAAVQRRAQGGDEGELVGGVGGGPQGEQEMADLRGDVDDRGVLGAVRDGEPGERRLEHRQRRAGREQHGDVVGAARAQPAVAVADRPSLDRGPSPPRRRRRPPRARATPARSTSPAELSWASTPSTVTVPWSRRPSRQVWSGTKAGCTSGWAGSPRRTPR